MFCQCVFPLSVIYKQEEHRNDASCARREPFNDRIGDTILSFNILTCVYLFTLCRPGFFVFLCLYSLLGFTSYLVIAISISLWLSVLQCVTFYYFVYVTYLNRGIFFTFFVIIL